ncbi:galactose mutarotase [Irregularibacter muris]|uniref:Aldose 1-epimerase n=1 Tax=Irregularibacter muris TaxID=1796619 RepID=A0AAE3HFG8_9FIRM|nr:aldose epimerase family protein [Irregularibacter muris]MCR1898537.1 galactose mutarotase [Irregularibacter muris]
MYFVEEAFKLGHRKIDLITVKNKRNMEIKLINYGAALVELLVPDKNGIIENIILSHRNKEDYIENPSYFGATVGRTAGRIAKGLFSLDGQEYQLNKNYGVNQGHGGPEGFSHRIWEYRIQQYQDRTMVEFSYKSIDKEENYPGNLEVRVYYVLTENNHLIIEYKATADKKTLCNLTNHTYFNLSGNQKRKVTEQSLKIKSDYFLEIDEDSIPTGQLIETAHTPMDFREGKRIGRDIKREYGQLRMTKGYDHTWLLKNENNQIKMWDDISGRIMTITTTYPSVVIYSYNFPNNEELKGGGIAEANDGICFETQFEPDGINHSNLHSAILMPEGEYHEKTQYVFSII